MELRASLNSSRHNSMEHNVHDFKKENEKDVDFIFIENGRLAVMHNPSKDYAEKYEISMYEQLYSKSLESQNERHIKSRHKDRVKKMEDIYKNKNTHPDEFILQVGNINTEKPNREEIRHMLVDFLKDFTEKFPNFHFLDAMVHMDEKSTHMHFRYIYDYEDEYGCRTIGKTGACEELGYDITDEEKAEIGRLKRVSEQTKHKDDIRAYKEYKKEHNLIKGFTADVRTMWQDACDKNGFEVIRTPMIRGQKGVDINTFKEQGYAQATYEIQEFQENAENLIIEDVERQRKAREEAEKDREEARKERAEAQRIKALYEAKYKEQEQREQNEQTAKQEENSLKARLWDRMSK